MQNAVLVTVLGQEQHVIITAIALPVIIQIPVKPFVWAVIAKLVMITAITVLTVQPADAQKHKVIIVQLEHAT